jgi:hypothetical protein
MEIVILIIVLALVAAAQATPEGVKETEERLKPWKKRATIFNIFVIGAFIVSLIIDC